CNCNPRDVAYANGQITLSEKRIKYENEKDKYFISYLFDMGTVQGGGDMNGVSAFLLRNKGLGYYASFRSNNSFYSPHAGMSYYTHEDFAENYQLEPLNNTRISSWLFSTGMTRKVMAHDLFSTFAYGGLGLGANSMAEEYTITEAGYTGDFWVTNERQNLFLSPEIGVIANVYDYFSVMAGIKYPISLTKHESLTTKGLSVMVGAGIKLKNLEPRATKRSNTYVAYTIDIPDSQGSDKLQSTNLIGISTGTISYEKMGAYFTARINTLLLSAKETSDLGENAIYTGVSDYGNAFGMFGLTWMYFYGGIGISYQKEYKSYENEGVDVWNSSREKVGICTEFGLNLRLLDRLLLRGGLTFPGFSLSSKENEFTMGANKMYYSLGIGYVLP
ncbi:MAG: hypothetical protein LBQ73_06070, partial [Tannerellaceae bacterium]|nr:hypothetical protein [Tannerellaceae bacterium]